MSDRSAKQPGAPQNPQAGAPGEKAGARFRPQPKGGSAPSVASLVFGCAGLVCGYAISWIACVVLGIVAVVFGVIARRTNAAKQAFATIGLVLGALCVVVSLGLVVVLLMQMNQLGLL